MLLADPTPMVLTCAGHCGRRGQIRVQPLSRAAATVVEWIVIPCPVCGADQTFKPDEEANAAVDEGQQGNDRARRL